LQKLAKQIEGYETKINDFIQSLTNFRAVLASDKTDPNYKKNVDGEAVKFFDSAKAAGIKMPDKFDGLRQKGTTEMAQEIFSKYPTLLEDINSERDKIYGNSATTDAKPGVTERYYGRGPTGGPLNYVGRMSTSGLPSISNPVDYGKKSISPNYQYQSGSSYTYTPPVADIKVPSIPKMSSSGPVISTVPKSNFGGIFDRSSTLSSSSSSVNIGTLSVNYPKAPDNAKEFFAQVEEIARQKGIKVTSGGKKAQ